MGAQGRVASCAWEQLCGGPDPWSTPRHWAPQHLLDTTISLYFSAAFDTPGSKLQAVDDDPGLAPGDPELHEDTTVSFRPGSEEENQPRGWALVIASLMACLFADGQQMRGEVDKAGDGGMP